jgi:hypothetical protein
VSLILDWSVLTGCVGVRGVVDFEKCVSLESCMPGIVVALLPGTICAPPPIKRKESLRSGVNIHIETFTTGVPVD